MEFIIMAIVVFYILSAVAGGLGKSKTGRGRTPPPGQGRRRMGPPGMPSFGGWDDHKHAEARPAKPMPRDIAEPSFDVPQAPSQAPSKPPYEIPQEAREHLPFEPDWLNDPPSSDKESQQQAPFTMPQVAESGTVPDRIDYDLTKGEIGALPSAEEVHRRKAKNHPLFQGKSIVHGVIWSEILSPPKSRRRR